MRSGLDRESRAPADYGASGNPPHPSVLAKDDTCEAHKGLLHEGFRVRWQHFCCTTTCCLRDPTVTLVVTVEGRSRHSTSWCIATCCFVATMPC